MSLKTSQKKLALFFFLPVIVSSLIAGMAYILDPFSIIHTNGVKLGILTDMRKQASGAIRSQQFSGYILGTSMLENTSARHAETLLGGTWANISMSGSSLFEREFALAYLLQSDLTRSVIYSIDDSYLNNRKGRDDYPVDQFAYLYDDNIWNDLRIYADKIVLACIFKSLLGGECISQDMRFDRPSAWLNHPSHAERFGGLMNWLAAKNNEQIIAAFKTIVASGKLTSNSNQEIELAETEIFINVSLKYVDDHLLSYALLYPSVDFHLIFPPYSRIRYALWHQTEPKNKAIHEAVVRHVVSTAEKMPNVFIYGYEDQDFPDDIALYKDPGHYHHSINERMLVDIQQAGYRLTLENIDRYLDNARRKSESFDLKGLALQIENYLAQSKADY
ncbi:hypothetical protein [Chrysiogenes arsenatis]|uniref:hypothetical protein n=1 Tax=Chrysiogenes arsenatis TaxID=309797 RepID=UPI0003FB602D|nr:hypothetical protein [Chrysiogenes arsenatis]